MPASYYDADGVLIEVGTRVVCNEAEPNGTVVDLIDVDGDYDGERYTYIGPFVDVLWDGTAEPERFGFVMYDFDAPFVCEDIVAVPA